MNSGEQVYISDLSRHDGETVTMRGWLHNRRKGGKLQFLVFRDGSGFMQAVVSKADLSEETWERTRALTQESSIELQGTVQKDERAPGGFELTVSDVKVFQIAENYPITPKEHGVNFLLDNRHLNLPKMQVQSCQCLANMPKH